MIFPSLFPRKNILRFKSKINREIRVVIRKGKKTVYVGGAEQTGGTITGMWEEAFRIIQSRSNRDKIQNSLILGLGGGDVLRILAAKFTAIKMDCVELDPVMIEAAENFFNIRQIPNLQIIQADAYKYMKKNRKRYDLIVTDLFIGKYNPEIFRKKDFLSFLKKGLTDQGLAVYNSHFKADETHEFRDFDRLCRDVFGQVSVIVKYKFSRILILC